jgi:hypothetical protein
MASKDSHYVPFLKAIPQAGTVHNTVPFQISRTCLLVQQHKQIEHGLI